MITRLAVSLGLLASLSGPAAATGWDGAFPESALATWLGGPVASASVVDGASGPTEQLVSSLRGIVSRVERCDLGTDTSTSLQDAELVLVCAQGGAERVIVVREVDREAPGASVIRRRPRLIPTAAVVIYDRGARVVASFMVARGEQLAPRVSGPVDAARMEAERAFRAGRITWVGPNEGRRPAWAKSSSPEGGDAPLETGFYLGEGGYRLEPQRLYKELGIPELAEDYDRNVLLQLVAQIGGAVLMGGGVAQIGVGAAAVSDPDGLNLDASPWLFTGIGIGTVLLGAAAVIMGTVLSPHPLSEAELRAMAKLQEDLLRQRLGLPGPEDAPKTIPVAPPGTP